MRQPPKRAVGRGARGAASASVSDESPSKKFSSVVQQEQRLGSRPESSKGTLRSKEGQGRRRMFRVGDAVLASTTARNPTPREATVVEVDPSDGSRLKIVFKDKRKKGGWREERELSALLRHTNAGSASSELSLSDSFSSFEDDSAALRTGPAPPHRGANSRTKKNVRDTPSQPSEIGEDSPRQKSRQLPGTAAIGARESSEVATATSPGALGCYRVGDVVLLVTAGKSACEATVVEADPSNGSRFKIAFRNKRKKGGWRDKSELFAPPLRHATDAGSTSARPTASDSACSSSFNVGTGHGGTSATQNQSSTGVLEQARTPKFPKTSEASGTTAGAKTSRQGLQQSVQQRREPPSKVGGETAAAPAALAGPPAGKREGASRSPKRKRSAATAAAAAISSSARKRRSVGAGAGAGRSGSAATKKQATKLKRGSNDVAAAGAGAARSGTSTKTPRRKDWQRPKVVTPGSVEGRPEVALRTKHPTEIIRPRRQFKVQQQAGVTPRAMGDGSTPSSSSSSSQGAARRSSFSIGLGSTAKAGPRRMLYQPAHSVQDANRGLCAGGGGGGGGGGGSRGVRGAENDDADSEFVRRGRRVRRQVHPSLSEDTMAAVNGGIEIDHDSSDEEGEYNGSGGSPGNATFRFRTSEAAPWGQGDRPLIKVRLSLLEGGAALSAERSALAVVTFVFDRHRYSSEQLANVLTAEGFLCYRDEDTRVFVLTEGKKADREGELRRVRELSLSQCGVEVEVSPWLEGRPALDEFLDNHRRVLDHIVRHRLACGMWTEVGGVYFNALFCGRRSKRTFNGVRLGINLAVEHNRALESGVWELWMTVEPAVHRFSPVDWWALMKEKKDKGLTDFSGSKSDDLEERLQVVCLPKLSRGVVHDVKEDAFEMDLLQEANLKRGYLIGPTSEDEMVLTYPSWCVVRGQREIIDATRAMRSRILGSFADALDGMEGVRVMETTFSWPVRGGDGGERTEAKASGTASAVPGMFGNSSGWATAGGRAIEDPSASASPSPPPSPAPDAVAVDDTDHIHDGVAARGGGGCGGGGGAGCALPSKGDNRVAPVPRTPGSNAAAGVGGGDGKRSSAADRTGDEGDQEKGRTVSIATPLASSSPPPLDSRPVCRPEQTQSPESKAAAAAAQASVAAVRQSFVRRRGTVVPRRVPAAAAAAAAAATAAVDDHDASGAAVGISSSAPRLCSTPFIIRRQPPLTASSASALRPSAGPSTGLSASDRGSGRESGGGMGSGKRRPLDLSAGKTTAVTVPDTEGGASPSTPGMNVGANGGETASAGPPPTAARVVTPAAESEAAVAVDPTAARGTRRKRRKDLETARSHEGGRSSDGKERKRSKKAKVAAGSASAGGGGGGGAGAAGVAGADAGQATPAAPLVVTFSADGSLGMGLEADANEEGTMCLAGKAPTSAAAVVPDGWRITAVNGKCARGLGDEKIAALLTLRPVEVTFEEPTKVTAPASAVTAPRKRAAPTKSKAAPASAVTKPKAGTKAKAPKGKGKGKARAKKANAVTTVRKTFKVQARNVPREAAEQGDRGSGSGGGGGGGGGGGHGGAVAVQASSTSAVI